MYIIVVVNAFNRGELKEVENRLNVSLKNLVLIALYYDHSKTVVLSKRCYLVRKKEILIFMLRTSCELSFSLTVLQ